MKFVEEIFKMCTSFCRRTTQCANSYVGILSSMSIVILSQLNQLEFYRLLSKMQIKCSPICHLRKAYVRSASKGLSLKENIQFPKTLSFINSKHIHDTLHNFMSSVFHAVCFENFMERVNTWNSSIQQSLKRSEFRYVTFVRKLLGLSRSLYICNFR